jgi:hypothetical protein
MLNDYVALEKDEWVVQVGRQHYTGRPLRSADLEWGEQRCGASGNPNRRVAWV